MNTINVPERICNLHVLLMICGYHSYTICDGHNCTICGLRNHMIYDLRIHTPCDLRIHTTQLLPYHKNIPRRLLFLSHPFRFWNRLHRPHRRCLQRLFLTPFWEIFHRLLQQTILDPHTVHQFVWACHQVS